jgi:hypothetical protein
MLHAAASKAPIVTYLTWKIQVLSHINGSGSCQVEKELAKLQLRGGRANDLPTTSRDKAVYKGDTARLPYLNSESAYLFRALSSEKGGYKLKAKVKKPVEEKKVFIFYNIIWNYVEHNLALSLIFHI